jgi:Transposase DDE domain group 1
VDSMSWPKGLVVEVGGHGIVSHAGSAATRLLADRTGLTGGMSGALARRGFAPLHDRGRVLAGLAVAIAGGATTIGEIDTLRHQEELFGPVASDTTVRRTLAGCDAAVLARISKARAKARRHVRGLAAARHGGIPAARVAGRDLGEVIVVRLDAAIVVAHSDKQQAKGTFKGTYGFHPLTAWCDNTDESLAVELRPGNAGSNTAADHIALAAAAIAQIPAIYRRKMLFTCDGAGSAHALAGHLTRIGARRGFQVHYPVGFDFDERICDVLPRLPEPAWTAAPDADGTPRPDAQVAELTGLLRRSAAGDRLAGWPADMPILIRREKPPPPAPGYPCPGSTRASGTRPQPRTPGTARSSSSKPATGPRPGQKPGSAAGRTPACGTCPPGTTRPASHGARPLPWPVTCSPGCGSSPSTATSQK